MMLELLPLCQVVQKLCNCTNHGSTDSISVMKWTEMKFSQTNFWKYSSLLQAVTVFEHTISKYWCSLYMIIIVLMDNNQLNDHVWNKLQNVFIIT